MSGLAQLAREPRLARVGRHGIDDPGDAALISFVKFSTETASTPSGFPKSTGTAAPSLRSQAMLAWFARAGSPGYIKPIDGERKPQQRLRSGGGVDRNNPALGGADGPRVYPSVALGLGDAKVISE
ncbi:hypothetical protein G3480_12835 [Thiorhodococcus mannitoliphagus]|uniref:Uncharacterized protein n=1 Tax=Thiorhodococcus mannitoliphagus TaxID=329406 RepID=A0A6P1DSV4_9GAMM|nr:hypothetical protein [Thiorhodococcus mannitoliphagus]NEX21188.1 hypothetical protein [Thiorhodococcus mannitoliphagus]